MKSLKFLGYEGYAITENGRVYSFKTNKFIGSKSGDYNIVTLTRNIEGKAYSKPELVHRLVALTFLEKPHGKDIVNHIDGNKTNNHYKNLEWCTYSENAIHAIETGLRKVTINSYRPIPDHVAYQICKLLEEGSRNKDICSALDVNQTLVSSIKSGAVYPDISEGFNFRAIPSSNRISESKVISICEDLQEGSLSVNRIRIKYNVSFNVVKNIKDRKTYTYISNNYNW